MKKKKIDWEEVDKEFDGYLEKCMLVDEQIAEGRKIDKPLQEDCDKVNRFIEDNNLDAVYLEVKDSKRD